ncbi:MAG: very short patch repair endonuclease [Muribaculum sp.]|nr:very short patch repair endonuclease [Muribaculum sp.]
MNKIERNQNRDIEVNQKLCAMGWTVVRFWGKEILSHTDECIRAIEDAIFDIEMTRFDGGLEDSNYT